MADEHQVTALFEEAEWELGPLVGLVNNAGVIGDARPLGEQDAQTLQRLIAVNLLGPMLCSHEAVNRLSTRRGGDGGAIVTITSVAARLGGLSGLVPYAATKGALESFTRGLANKVSPEGIRVNAVAPGLIQTDMSSPEGVEASKTVPMRRMGRPEEVAEAVGWLMSPAASYVTGTTVTVSGGR